MDQTSSTPQPDNSQTAPLADDVSNSAAKDPLTSGAEDFLAHEVALLIEAPKSSEIVPKSVREVIQEMAANEEELSIALDFGPGESGIDQVSWNLEVNTLKRAYAKNQARRELGAIEAALKAQNTKTLRAVDPVWVQKTQEIINFSSLCAGQSLPKQALEEFRRTVFEHDEYVKYIDLCITPEPGENILRAAISELTALMGDIQAKLAVVINPENIDYVTLAKEIIKNGGDIDLTTHQLERNSAIASLNATIADADEILAVLGPQFLKDYRRWSYGLDLNVREILAIETSVSAPDLSEKSFLQIKDLLTSAQPQLERLSKLLLENTQN